MGNSPAADSRAWVEVDLDIIAHNAKILRSLLPDGCDLMAVVKADAYGHGAKAVSARLEREGIRAFAVATVSEGIDLREGGLSGEVLVMGYTSPADAELLCKNNLTQLAVDGAHARALDETGYSIRIHIAVDTGMHRLGIEYSDLAEIESVYACRNLTIEGIASHLASSDSADPDDMVFTQLQIGRFTGVVESLANKGYSVGRRHIQASFGVLNYPDADCDYARTGIALYGVMSRYGATDTMHGLKPALALRARIAEVRMIGAGESVSYGRTFTAEKAMKLATVCIGYADGVPRQMSGKGGVCIVSGKTAPIVGRICMDLLMVDVTGAGPVSAGDVVTLIGTDSGNTIRCEDVAEASGTITNDLLCRLGSRLPRVYLEAT